MSPPFANAFLLGLLSFGICYLGVPIVRVIASSWRILDRPGGHKAHDESTPLLGGVAIFSATWAVLLGLTAFGDRVEPLAPFQWDHQLQGIFLGSSVIFLMGLLDDLRGLEPVTKFIVQLGASLVVVIHGVSVTLFLGRNALTILITVLWVVGITNSFNLLDNMDGLCAGVAAICSGIFSMIALRQGDIQTLYLSVVLLGALLAFLRFNFDPAEIFMGDAGSTFIGFYLGCLGVSANYLEHSQLPQLPIVAPLLIFSVPLFDTFSVMLIRLLEGRSIWEADNNHFSHRLVSLGISRRGAVLLIYLVTFTVGILATLLSRVVLTDALLLLVHGVAIFGIIILLEYAGATRQEDSTDF